LASVNEIGKEEDYASNQHAASISACTCKRIIKARQERMHCADRGAQPWALLWQVHAQVRWAHACLPGPGATVCAVATMSGRGGQ